MPKIVVNFSRNPSDEWESLVGLAETSRNVIELARLYQWGRSHWHTEVSAAAKKRALQLGYRVSDLEADQRGALLRENLTDRAQRYRANAEPPDGPKVCLFCGTRSKLMVGHLNGRDSDNTPDNLHWTCRSCNTLHANALKRARMGKRTAQFNPSKSGGVAVPAWAGTGAKWAAQFNPSKSGGGAKSLGQWIQAVGAITPHKYPDRNEALKPRDTMKVSDAVEIIRATSPEKRSQFAAQIAAEK
jgi:hypothetical protein